MKEVKLVDSAQLNFNLRGETPDGTAYVARALGADVSPNMGIGFARWEGAEVSWKLL
ncbi:ethanolamine utilization protein EutQ, partial [Acinetobacter baumannii]